MTVRAAILLLVPLVTCLAVPTNCPEAAGQNQENITSKQSLYERFRNNYHTNHEIAYEAAQEYLRLYPDDRSENANLMRR